MRVGIVAQQGNSQAVALAGDIRCSVAADVVVDETTAESLDASGVPIDEMDECDLVVSIGGDGTFLYTARKADATPIMGVNLGEVGFLNATPPENAVDAVEQTIDAIEDGTAVTRTIPRMTARGDGWEFPPALNEVALMGPQRGHGNGIEVDIRIDDSLYAGGHADGVLVSTATGSTAYSLSEGGPLVHPDVSGFLINEMCATATMRPLVVSLDSDISIRIDGAERAFAVGDGRIREELEPPTRVSISRAETPVHVAGPELDFFAALGKLD